MVSFLHSFTSRENIFNASVLSNSRYEISFFLDGLVQVVVLMVPFSALQHPLL